MKAVRHNSKTFVQIESFKGVNIDDHPRMIPEDQLSDCNNVWLTYGKIRQRFGYRELGTNLPLAGVPIHVKFFDKLSSTSNFLLALTSSDIYYHQGSSDTWLFLTPIHTTGQAACAGTTAVTGAASAWDNVNWPSLVYYIGFGTQDPDAVTTWYRVASFDTPTALTLESAGPNTGGNVNYVIRMCFRGNISNYQNVPDWTVAIDGSVNDNIFIVSNGIDPVMKFRDLAATPQFTALAPVDLATVQGKFVEYYEDHVFLANIVDTGTPFPTSIAYSVRGDPSDWSGTGSGITMLTRDETKITALKLLKKRLYVFKEQSITEVWHDARNAAAPFLFDENKFYKVGCPAGRTIQVIEGKFLIFLGNDNVYVFDGMNLQPVGKGISDYLIDNINKTCMNKFFSIAMQEYSLYLLFVVEGSGTDINKCYCFDYKKNAWTIWTLNDTMSGGGDYSLDTSERWVDVTVGTRWLDMVGTWGDETVVGGVPVPALCGLNGYIYDLDENYVTDNAAAISAGFTTADLEFDDPKQAKGFIEMLFTHSVQASGDIQMRVSVDFGDNWSDWRTITMTGDGAVEDKAIAWMQRGKQIRVQIQNVSGSMFEIEDLIAGFEVTGLEVRR